MINEISQIVGNVIKQMCVKKVEEDSNQKGHKILIETILNTLKQKKVHCDDKTLRYVLTQYNNGEGMIIDGNTLKLSPNLVLQIAK